MPWDPEEQDRLDELEPVYYDVPEHLEAELWGWVSKVLDGWVDRMESIFNVLRVKSPGSEPGGILYTNDKYLGMFEGFCSEPEGMLTTIRAILKDMSEVADPKRLERILKRGHSGYAVRMDQRGLEYRVIPAAREQIETAVKELPDLPCLGLPRSLLSPAETYRSPPTLAGESRGRDANLTNHEA